MRAFRVTSTMSSQARQLAPSVVDSPLDENEATSSTTRAFLPTPSLLRYTQEARGDRVRVRGKSGAQPLIPVFLCVTLFSA